MYLAGQTLAGHSNVAGLPSFNSHCLRTLALALTGIRAPLAKVPASQLEALPRKYTHLRARPPTPHP